MKKNIFKFISLASFIAFAAISLATVNGIHSNFASTVLVSGSSLPLAWSPLPPATEVTTNLDVVTSDAVVIYQVSLRNTASSPRYITSLASFMDEAHGSHDG